MYRLKHVTKHLAKMFFREALLTPLILPTIKDFQLHFNQGIAVYEMTESCKLLVRSAPIMQNEDIMTIGLYQCHVFLITDIKQFDKTYACPDCQGRFTMAANLSKQVKRYCQKGQTKVSCPGNQIQPPESAYEKACVTTRNFGRKAIAWLGYEAEQRGEHVCKHAGEMRIAGKFVDGLQQDRDR